MIEHGLFFVAGMFFSALLAVLAFPLLWQRALRLTYARLEQALPLSFDEVLADQDRIRAKHAVEIAKLEQMNAQFAASITRAKAENSVLRAEKIKQEEAMRVQIEQMPIREADYHRICNFVDTQRETIIALLTLLTLAPTKTASFAAPALASQKGVTPLYPPMQFDEIPVMQLTKTRLAAQQDGDDHQTSLLAPPPAIMARKKRSRKAKVT